MTGRRVPSRAATRLRSGRETLKGKYAGSAAEHLMHRLGGWMSSIGACCSRGRLRLLHLGGIAAATALQNLYEVAFDVEPSGMKDTPRRLIWLGVLICAALRPCRSGRRPPLPPRRHDHRRARLHRNALLRARPNRTALRCGGRFEFFAKVETAGIEPASAVACEVASTSVAGALISPSTRLAGGVAESQLRKLSSDRPERTSPSKPAS